MFLFFAKIFLFGSLNTIMFSFTRVLDINDENWMTVADSGRDKQIAHSAIVIHWTLIARRNFDHHTLTDLLSRRVAVIPRWRVAATDNNERPSTVSRRNLHILNEGKCIFITGSM